MACASQGQQRADVLQVNGVTVPLSESGTMSVMTLFLLPRPPLATRLLAHKIQSPQEWEAIQALTVRKNPGVS